MYLGTTIAFLPFMIRLMQCLKKFNATHHAFPHLVNAGKYATGVIMIACSTAHVVFYQDNATQTARTWTSSIWILYVVVRLLNSFYSWFWDVTMDWGLFRQNSVNCCLRDDLLVTRRGVYWAMIIGDAFLRLFWISLLFAYKFADDLMYESLTAFVEVVRRSFWAYFRVELEAVANYEDYRTILVVPPLNTKVSEQPPAKETLRIIRRRRNRRNSDPTSSKSPLKSSTSFENESLDGDNTSKDYDDVRPSSESIAVPILKKKENDVRPLERTHYSLQ